MKWIVNYTQFTRRPRNWKAVFHGVTRGSAALALFAAAAFGQNTIYDAASVFEPGFAAGTDPTGPWTYGYSNGLTGAVTPYSQRLQNGINGPNAQYWTSPGVNIGDSPSVEYQNGPNYDDGNVDLLANQLVLVSGIGGETSDLVFTAPASGIFDVDATFRGDQFGIGTAVGVSIDGTLLFDSGVHAEGQTVPFSTELTLTIGDQVVFSVAPDGGLQNTGIEADITQTPTSQTPEPSTLTMVAIASLLLVISSKNTLKQLKSILHVSAVTRRIKPGGASARKRKTMKKLKDVVAIPTALLFASSLFGQVGILGPAMPVSGAPVPTPTSGPVTGTPIHAPVGINNPVRLNPSPPAKPQTISFPAPNNIALPASAFLASASASSGLAVTVSSSTPAVCTVNGAAVTVKEPGTCSLVATQPGNGTYAAANSVVRSFSVTVSPGAQLCNSGQNGPGGYYNPSTSGCQNGKVVPYGDEVCGTGGQATIYSPSQSYCQNGVVVPFGGAYCGRGINGPGGPYNPQTEYCDSGAAVSFGDLYCTRGANGPGGEYSPRYDYCSAGNIIPW